VRQAIDNLDLLLPEGNGTPRTCPITRPAAPLASQAARKYGSDNSYAVARVLIDSEVYRCAEELKGRWMTRLNGVDVWAASHCHTALVYFEWEVGPRRRA
jgi:hypothetical protein